MAKNNININRAVQDPFYRYKMPRIVAKVEGKGNGIKTVIANMPEIAKALSRPPTYPTKYFGCELGAQTNFDLKNDRYIVNGEHDANKLQEILDGFIKRFVLCPECENPETVLTVKRQLIHGKCKACGHSYTVDGKHKLATFVVKNPPPVESANTESATDNTKQQEKENGGGSPAAEEANGGEEVLIGNGGGAVENGRNGSGGGSNADEEEDDDWAPADSTEDSKEKLSGQISKLVIDKDLDKPMKKRLDMLHQFFVKAIKNNTIQDTKLMLNEAERLDLKNKAPLLLPDVLFGDAAGGGDGSDLNVVAKIRQHRNLLLRFCVDDEKAQRYLLGGIEHLVQEKKDVLLPKTAHIIKALYDNDICEEEVLLKWGKKPSTKFVDKDKELVKEMIRQAEPVLKWLAEAEEASEEESDDDGVAFDDRSRNVGMTVTNEAKAKGSKASGKENDGTGENGQMMKKAAKNEEVDEAEDVDIDNI